MAKLNDIKQSFSAIEKAKEKALKESHYYKDAQTGKFSSQKDLGSKTKADSIKITIKK